MGKSKMKLAYWFVPQVGMVQQHLQSDRSNAHELEKMTAPKP